MNDYIINEADEKDFTNGEQDALLQILNDGSNMQ